MNYNTHAQFETLPCRNPELEGFDIKTVETRLFAKGPCHFRKKNHARNDRQPHPSWGFPPPIPNLYPSILHRSYTENNYVLIKSINQLIKFRIIPLLGSILPWCKVMMLCLIKEVSKGLLIAGAHAVKIKILPDSMRPRKAIGQTVE